MLAIPNGCAVDRFVPDAGRGAAFRRQHGLSEHETIVGCAARVDPAKDHSTLVQAISLVRREYPDLRLVLAGLGTETGSSPLHDLIKRHGLEDCAVGLGIVSDMAGFMNAIDLHALSSSFGEAFPGVICEALACGTPCVATDLGDCAEIIGSPRAIVAPKSPGELARAITAMLATRNTFDGENASRSIANRYSFETMIARYRVVIEAVVAKEVHR